MKRGVHAEGFNTYTMILLVPESLQIRVKNCSYRWSAQVLPCRKVHDKQVLRFHQFFLHAGWGDINALAITNRGAAASAGDLFRGKYMAESTIGFGTLYPAKGVELLTQFAN